MTVFRSPLYMAFSYEENQGPTHSILAGVLRHISVFVNTTTEILSSEVRNLQEDFQIVCESLKTETYEWFL